MMVALCERCRIEMDRTTDFSRPLQADKYISFSSGITLGLCDGCYGHIVKMVEKYVGGMEDK